MEIGFRDTNAQRVYRRFLATVDEKTSALRPEDRAEIRKELISHLYESMNLQAISPDQEMTALLDAMDRLGNIEEIVDPIIADKTIEYARSSFNPELLIRAYQSNSGMWLRRAVILALFSLFNMLVTLVVLVAVSKLFNPAYGFYLGPKIQWLGTVDEGTDAKEVLGYWIIPLSALLALALYRATLLVLRLFGVKK